MSETKFKVGDRVMCTDNGHLGVITEVDVNERVAFYEVKFDDGEETYIMESDLELSDEPPYCKKTAFLTELKELMEKYGVEIDINSTNGDEEEGIMFLFGKEYISYTSRPFNPNKLKEFIFPITPSNIFDYDK